MRKPVSLLLTTVVAAFFGVACSKSEPKQEPSAAQEQKSEAAPAAPAEKELKIGQTMPYSGPASAYGQMGKVETAFFAKLNREGGIDGVKINLISLDDSYSPPRTVEQTRKLVEQEKVSFVFGSVGTAANSAVQKYLNTKQVPQLLVSSGATKWNDPKNFPYTIGFNPSYQREGRTYAEHILANNPKAKIAVLYQNDDLGKDLLEGLKHGLGDKAAKQIVAEASYEASDPTVDSQIVTLKGSKADTVVFFTTPKFGAQAIRKVDDLGWKPTRYITNVSASVGATLTPAGLERSKGLLTVGFTKDPTDTARWGNDADVKEWLAFMKAELPQADIKDGSNVFGYIQANVLVQILKQCKGDFSAKNIMKEAANLKGYVPPMVQPGVEVNTGADDFELFDRLGIAKFTGERWAAENDPPAAAKATN
ncbi:MAG: ABC transporter substrate-binding protein [Polyangiales bacterium]